MVEETNLPGVGKMFTVEIGDEEELKIVIHNTGRREVYLREEPGEDSRKLFELSDKLARVVGTILDGSYFQPVSSEEAETKLGGESVLEWVEVSEGSEVVGKKLGEVELLEDADISVIAILRGDELLTDLGPDTAIEEGDRLVVVEPEKGHGRLCKVCEGIDEACDG